MPFNFRGGEAGKAEAEERLCYSHSASWSYRNSGGYHFTSKHCWSGLREIFSFLLFKSQDEHSLLLLALIHSQIWFLGAGASEVLMTTRVLGLREQVSDEDTWAHGFWASWPAAEPSKNDTGFHVCYLQVFYLKSAGCTCVEIVWGYFN